MKALDEGNRVVTFRLNDDLLQGETEEFPFVGDRFAAYTFTSIMVEVATETTTMDVLQRHIISSDYKNTVFEQNFDSTGTVELTKDLSSIFGK